MKPLATERLILQEFDLNDYQFIIELLNAESWLKFIGNRNINTKEDAELYIETLIKSYNNLGYGLYRITLSSNLQTVGMCGLVKRDFLDMPDIGFALLPKYEGLGYAYEASKAILNFAKTDLGFNHILAIANENNVKSISLLHKIGLLFERKVMVNHTELALFTSALR